MKTTAALVELRWLLAGLALLGAAPPPRTNRPCRRA